jgi:hypothetical protein
MYGHTYCNICHLNSITTGISVIREQRLDVKIEFIEQMHKLCSAFVSHISDPIISQLF